MVIGRHALGVHKTCVHETFGTVRSIFITTSTSFITTSWSNSIDNQWGIFEILVGLANLANLLNTSAKLKQIVDTKWFSTLVFIIHDHVCLTSVI